MYLIVLVKIFFFVCIVCNFVVYERCLKLVVFVCFSIVIIFIKNLVVYCFSIFFIFKRKFCDVCRKRLEDSVVIRCECKFDFYY